MHDAPHDHGRSDDGRTGRAARTLVTLAWASALAAQAGRILLAGPVRAAGVVGEPALLMGGAELLIVMALSTIGGLVVLRSAQQRYGRLLMGFAIAISIVGVATEYSAYALLVVPERGLPLGLTAGWLQDLWMVPQAFGVLLVPLLFPDGRPPARSWNPLFRLMTWSWVVLIVAFMVAERPLSNAFLDMGSAPANPTGFLPVPAIVLDGAWATVLVLSIVMSLVGLVARWRTAARDMRLQLMWVLYGLGLVLGAMTVFVADTLLEELSGIDVVATPLPDVLLTAAVLALVIALGVAVLRHRLYDIDLVVNRTLVYGVLTAAVVATYVVIVVGVGALVPGSDRTLSLVATGVVAVAFHPARVRIQRVINRLMFGRRDDPYTVLSELGRELARSAAPGGTLQTVVDTVGEALKLPWVAVELDHRDGHAIRAEHGSPGDTRAADLVVVPLVHDDDVVGRLMAAPRSPHEPLRAKDRRLLEDVAYQAGAVAHAVRLTTDLQRSRERLVATREEERRRMRRDLHDGLGPSLASQTFKLDAALDRLDTDPEGVSRLLSSLKRETQQLVADIRRLVYDLRPPALDELGLAAALSAHAGHLDGAGGPAVDVVTEPDPLPALPAAVEVAAYRIAHEAITNVVRHAAAGRCTIALSAAESRLLVCVEDDGVGIADDHRPGVGLESMRERAEELNGTLTITSVHPAGTRVTALLPLGQSKVGRPPVAARPATTPRARPAGPATAVPTAHGASHG